MTEHPIPQNRRDQVLALLQTGQIYQAEHLATQLKVSVRTIYRDITTLRHGGIPIQGHPGRGYFLETAHFLPPLPLTPIELEALHLGLAILAEGPDQVLRKAALGLGERIDAALDVTTDKIAQRFGQMPQNPATMTHKTILRSAIEARQMVQVTTHDQSTTARPLQLRFDGRDWVGVFYDDTAAQFRTLRMAQITDITALPQLFTDSPGKTLADFSRGSLG